MFGKKKTIANKIQKNDDGTMEVTITFDPFNHGHSLGSPRNYNPEKYKRMVESNKTIEHIANGYGLGYYSHGVRSKSNPCVATESDNEGKTIYPACKTISMKWVNGLVEHTQRILNNKVGKEIQKLIESGVGGFSSVHNLNTSMFCGFDYVLAPNFSSNRAIVDNVCKNGVCSLNADSIVKDTIEDALSKTYGITDEVIVDAIVLLEKDTPDYDMALDMITKYKSFETEEEELRAEVEELRTEIGLLKDDATIDKDAIDAISTLSHEKELELSNQKIKLLEDKAILEKERVEFTKNISAQLDNIGFSLDENNEIKIKDISAIFDTVKLTDAPKELANVERNFSLVTPNNTSDQAQRIANWIRGR